VKALRRKSVPSPQRFFLKHWMEMTTQIQQRIAVKSPKIDFVIFELTFLYYSQFIARSDDILALLWNFV